MPQANKRQVAGTHYQTPTGYQHWDMVIDHNLNYFEGQITKYVMRCRSKNGVQDLQKALHFIEKYIESWDRVVQQPVPAPTPLPTITSDDGLKPFLTGVTCFDSRYQCEGYYGDKTELYKCRVCGESFRAPGLEGAHACHDDVCGLGGPTDAP